MSLLSQLTALDIPELYAQNESDDPTVYAVLGNVFTRWRWYITELDKDEHRAFGLVVGYTRELGYIYIEELDEGGCYIEATPKQPLSKVEGV